MINVIIIAVLAAFCAFGVRSVIKRAGGDCGCSGSGAKPITPDDTDRSHYAHEAVLTVPDMHCKNCVRRVSDALNGKDGVWACKTDLKKRTVHVLYKDGVAPETIAAAVQAAGYTVQGAAC